MLAEQAAAMQTLLGRIATAGSTAVDRLWQATSGDPERFVAAYPNTVYPFMGAASNVSAQWYSQLAPHLNFAAERAPLPPVEMLQANARWALKTADTAVKTAEPQLKTAEPQLKTADPAEAIKGTTERHVYNASRDTIKHNASREHVRYARQASETACAFCRMLATRQTLYMTEQSAIRVTGGRSGTPRGTRKLGDKFHDDCHCTFVPIRPGMTYVPPDYVEDWKREYDSAIDAEGNHGLKAIINHMRRQEYAAQHPDRVKSAG